MKSDFIKGNILEDKSPKIGKQTCCIPLLLASSLSHSTPARLCSDPSRLYKEIRADEQEAAFLKSLLKVEEERGEVGGKVEDLQQRLEGTEAVEKIGGKKGKKINAGEDLMSLSPQKLSLNCILPPSDQKSLVSTGLGNSLCLWRYPRFLHESKIGFKKSK